MRAPFYVMAPPFDERSAGNRVLYALAARLRALGEEVFVMVHLDWEAVWLPPPGPDPVPPLTPAVARRHRAAGLTPICIYPEVTSCPLPGGVNVVYLLNHPGAAGPAPDLTAYDYVLAYSGAIADGLSRCDSVLHLPVSDPTFWSPDPTVHRAGAAVYTGKYADLHGQSLPAELAGAVVIPRHGLGAPTPQELRDLFRASTHLYVFESTALAAEAVLCGCPVVYLANPFFPGHIGAQELGLAGFAASDDAGALATAADGVGAFRRAYLAALDRVDQAVQVLANDTQHLAAASAPATAVPVRPVQFPAAALGSPILRHRPRDRDVRLAYWLFLGREPESEEAVAGKRGRTPLALAGDLLSSAEFARRVAWPARDGAALPVVTFGGTALPELRDWAAASLPVAAATGAALARADTWPALLAAVLADPLFRRAAVLGGGWRGWRSRRVLARTARDLRSPA